MSILTELSEYSELQIHITPLKTVEARRDTYILRDGVPVGPPSYERLSVLAPGDDLTDVPEEIAAVARAAWTPDVVATYQARVAQAIAALSALSAMESARAGE